MLKVLANWVIINNMIRADIFIPTSNRRESLKMCLDSLNKQTNKNFHVFLVGLKPSEEIEKLVNSYKDLNITYFIQKDKGIIPAANEALQKSKHEFFIRVDDDVTFDKNWFDALVKTFDSDKKIGGVTGPTCMSAEGIKSRDLTKFLDTFKNSHNPLLKFLYKFYYYYIYQGKIMEVSTFLPSGAFTIGSNFPECLNLSMPVEVNNLEACNLSVRSDLLKKIGGFDTLYIKGLSDYHEADVALKIKGLGYKLIFNPKVSVEHHVEFGKVAAARPETFNRIQNQIIFYFRFFPIKSVDQLGRFLANLFLQNMYYVYKFLTTGSINQLSVIPGTFVGFFRVLFLREHEIKKN